MAISKGRTEGGQGGKLGHSNMNHWDYTEAIKAAARKQRRLQAKIQIANELEEFSENDDDSRERDLTDEFPQ